MNDYRYIMQIELFEPDFYVANKFIHQIKPLTALFVKMYSDTVDDKYPLFCHRCVQKITDCLNLNKYSDVIIRICIRPA